MTENVPEPTDVQDGNEDATEAEAAAAAAPETGEEEASIGEAGGGDEETETPLDSGADQ